MRTSFFAFFVLFLLAAMPAQAFLDDASRTARRLVTGEVFYPEHIFNKPEHAEFLPLNSNSDPQRRHPQQWDGQDWDATAWNGKKWTEKSAIRKFYDNRVFAGQEYVEDGKRKVPVLDLGPTFYKLSDLDQRRALKLVTDQANIFGQGNRAVILRDWKTRGVVGTYTPKGMFLN